MAKFRVEAKFYCYIDNAGMQKHILKAADLETEEKAEEDKDQGELELKKETSERPAVFSEADVFASFYPGNAVANNYFRVESIEGDSVKCQEAKDGAHYVYTGKEIGDKLTEGLFKESSQKMYDMFAKHNGTIEEAEAPVTADGTTVEEAVNNAIKNLVGHLDQPLALSGSENGIWSNKILDGDVEICKDEVHDLLNAEADGLRAVFVLTLKDKK